MPITPQEAAEKWIRNTSAATEAVRAGVNRVTEAPQQAAARSADLWQARVSSPEAKLKFQRRLSQGTLQEWKDAMLSKGIGRIAQGAQAARDKFQRFMSEWLPYVESVAQRVRMMPKISLEDRIQRMVAQVRGNAEFQSRM